VEVCCNRQINACKIPKNDNRNGDTSEVAFALLFPFLSLLAVSHNLKIVSGILAAWHLPKTTFPFINSKKSSNPQMPLPPLPNCHTHKKLNYPKYLLYYILFILSIILSYRIT
jgi:hypothetical protein